MNDNEITKEQQAARDREIEFLTEIHQAAQMGRDTLEHVNDNIGPGSLREAVEKDIFDYSDVCAQVTRKLDEKGEKPRSVGKLPRMMEIGRAHV